MCPLSKLTTASARFARRYVTALYWSIATLTTVGYGDISANQGSVGEVYYNILTLILGTLIYTLIIANLEDMVSQLDTTMSLFKEKLDSVKQYVRAKKPVCDGSGPREGLEGARRRAALWLAGSRELGTAGVGGGARRASCFLASGLTRVGDGPCPPC